MLFLCLLFGLGFAKNIIDINSEVQSMFNETTNLPSEFKMHLQLLDDMSTHEVSRKKASHNNPWKDLLYEFLNKYNMTYLEKIFGFDWKENIQDDSIESIESLENIPFESNSTVNLESNEYNSTSEFESSEHNSTVEFESSEKPIEEESSENLNEEESSENLNEEESSEKEPSENLNEEEPSEEEPSEILNEESKPTIDNDILELFDKYNLILKDFAEIYDSIVFVDQLNENIQTIQNQLMENLNVAPLQSILEFKLSNRYLKQKYGEEFEFEPNLNHSLIKIPKQSTNEKSLEEKLNHVIEIFNSIDSCLEQEQTETETQTYYNKASVLTITLGVLFLLLVF